MDPVTHVLAPVILTGPLARPAPATAIAEEVWRERLAILLGALLPDADGVTGFFSLLYYEKYHRVMSHSLVGLLLLSVICAVLAFRWPRRLWWPSWRWTRGEGRLASPPFRRLWLLASVALAAHFLGDWITAWGIWPLWPWLGGQAGNFALGRVNSIEPVILTMTVVAWGLQHWLLQQRKIRPAWLVAVGWFLAVALYVWLRPHFGEAAYV